MNTKCIRCGQCCTEYEKDYNKVSLTRREIEVIADRVGLPIHEFMRQYCTIIGTQTFLSYKESCPFLVGVGGHIKDRISHYKCDIYDIRPTQCRDWPHWDNIKPSHPLLKICHQTKEKNHVPQ